MLVKYVVRKYLKYYSKNKQTKKPLKSFQLPLPQKNALKGLFWWNKKDPLIQLISHGKFTNKRLNVLSYRKIHYQKKIRLKKIAGSKCSIHMLTFFFFFI